MPKIWQTRKSDPELEKEISTCLGISAIIARLLVHRGITTPALAQEFLECDVRYLKDPFLLRDMSISTERIRGAISRGEKIVVYGDYDADGICSTVMLVTALREMGADVDWYLPHRLEEGYGLNDGAIGYIASLGAKLLITVDCGINAVREVELANRNGLDVIVTDHHEIAGGKIPDAVGVINPLRRDCSYPYKELAGAGLAYKLIEALCGKDSAARYMDLVCLGTVADVAPITGENRILIKHGLSRIASGGRTGLEALMNVAGLGARRAKVSVEHIGYMLAPRINATGRIGSAENALRLLISDSTGEAAELAALLDRDNKERQKIENQTLTEAIGKIEHEVNFKDQRVIVLDDERWHPGVIGIVASRISERFYRPAILVAPNGGIYKGSGRSIRSFDLYAALCQCGNFLEGYGGHRYAAGLSISRENLPSFRKRINEIAFQMLRDEDLIPRIDVDAEVGLPEITPRLITEIENLAPFGPENRRPVFVTRNVRLKSEPRTVGKNHLKMMLTDGRTACEAMWFGMADVTSVSFARDGMDIAYSPDVNTYDGLTCVQLLIKDVKPAHAAF
jgi:single-stranded-DNA-specific exonuclease